jgi:hypothetical protein
MDRLDQITQSLDEPHDGMAQSCRTRESSAQDVAAAVLVEAKWQRRSYNEADKIALLALLFASDLDADQPPHTGRSSVSS